jgi:molecular chaperone GrpE
MNIKKVFRNMESKKKQTEASVDKKEADVKDEAQEVAAQDIEQQTNSSEVDGSSDEDTKEKTADDKEQMPLSDAEEEQKSQTENDEMAKKADALKKELDEEKDKYLRLAAEFDNYRRRTMKEKTELILNGSEKCVNGILPVLDDLERALSTMDKTEDIAAVSEGVQLIYNKFIKILESMGVKAIETEGKELDTDYHEAIALVPVPDEKQKGKIIDCTQKGYTLNEKVIRHAKVVIGQ